MTKAEVEHALASIKAGIQSGAVVQRIVAQGSGESNRDVELRLTAEQSKSILEAVAKVLKGM